tara:strand:+ start:953 stop:1873 length:921 start_codon:yes stop_codon:yes gene_type:complete
MSSRYSTGFVSATYNPLLNPDAPTIGTATAGGGQISITFTAPSIVGGSAITSYIATARKTSDGTTVTATGASSPIVITGLSLVAYTVRVAAVNSSGASALSAASNSATPTEPAPTVIGQTYGGGFYAGQIGVSSVATHYLVIGPVASAENGSRQWKTTNTTTTGTSSDIDGPTNSANMNNASHPAAQFCEGLTIGGFSDWYMPAKNELEVCYYNLKPTTTSNNTNTGINANAVPARASNYTTGTPAQTSATDFRSTGAEDFSLADYWSSTEHSATYAWLQGFSNGARGYYIKNLSTRVRAIRRVAV